MLLPVLKYGHGLIQDRYTLLDKNIHSQNISAINLRIMMARINWSVSYCLELVGNRKTSSIHLIFEMISTFWCPNYQLEFRGKKFNSTNPDLFNKWGFKMIIKCSWQVWLCCNQIHSYRCSFHYIIMISITMISSITKDISILLIWPQSGHPLGDWNFNQYIIKVFSKSCLY